MLSLYLAESHFLSQEDLPKTTIVMTMIFLGEAIKAIAILEADLRLVMTGELCTIVPLGTPAIEKFLMTDLSLAVMMRLLKLQLGIVKLEDCAVGLTSLSLLLRVRMRGTNIRGSLLLVVAFLKVSFPGDFFSMVCDSSL